jgi:hypothetical protein
MAMNDAQKKAFYTKQREDAEAGAAKGDQGAARTAARVYNKLSKKDDSGVGGFIRNTLAPTERQSKRNYYADEASGGKTWADVSDFSKKASDFVLQGEALGGALGGLGRLAKGVAGKLVPKAVEGTGISEAGAAVRQNLGRAKPVQKALKGSQDALKGDKSYALRDGGTTKPTKASTPKVSGSDTKALPKPKAPSAPKPQAKGGNAASPRDLLKNSIGIKEQSRAQKIGSAVKEKVGKVKDFIGDLKHENDRYTNPNYKRDMQMKADKRGRDAMARADRAEAKAKKGK